MFVFVADLLYRQTVNVQNSQLDVEIVDVSGETVSENCQNAKPPLFV
jgi:hypothetical protein